MAAHHGVWTKRLGGRAKMEKENEVVVLLA